MLLLLCMYRGYDAAVVVHGGYDAVVVVYGGDMISRNFREIPNKFREILIMKLQL